MPSFSEMQNYISTTNRSGMTPLNLVVLRNITVEGLEPFWQYEALRSGFDARVSFGAFDNIYQESITGTAALSQADVVMVFCYLDVLSCALTKRFPALTPAEIEQEKNRILAFVKDVVAGLRRQTKGLILWHGFESPLYPALGILDGQTAQGQRATVASLNDQIRQTLRSAGAYFVDMDMCRAREGKGFYDSRYWHIGKSPYSHAAGLSIAEEDFKFIRAAKGRVRKCLVLDCDNVLWGGIVGEDGIERIKLGKTFPGSCFVEFQEAVMDLHRRGILLALCSKNEPQDVWKVFQDHPDMVLKKEHIAAARVNWQDKASNLREIALELNIGLDSLVFADDSPIEIDLVRQLVPEVATLHLAVERADENRTRLASCGLFDTLSLSEEDRARGAMYFAESQRRELKSSLGSLEDFLKSLEMELCIKKADAFTIPRISQLTQRTNQFNLTTRRYSEAELTDMALAGTSGIFCAQLKDRFGDNGLIGVCIVHYKKGEAFIDSFMLSCRVLGRQVEEAFLAQMIKMIRQKGAVKIFAEYIPSPKNGIAKDFYREHHFLSRGTSDRGGELFEFSLNEHLPSPGMIRVSQQGF